jgi:hypothetical protein
MDPKLQPTTPIIFVGRGKIKCLNLGELEYLNLMNFITIE